MRLRPRLPLGLIALIGGLGACQPAAEREVIGSSQLALEGELIDDDDFDSGSWTGFWHANWCYFDYSCQLAPSPDAPGLSFRAEYRTADYNGDRETKGDELASPIIEHDEQWVGMRIYFSSIEFGPDSGPVIIVQHHGTPDGHLGETGRNPVTAFNYRDGQLVLDYKGSADQVTPKDADDHWVYTDQGRIEVGAPVLDAWNAFVMHTIWDPTGSSGLMEVWFNGEHQALTDINIAYNDDRRPYLKFGHYYWHSGESDFPVRVSYYDDIMIVGGPDGVFCDVAPPGSPMPPGESCEQPEEPADPGADGPFSPAEVDGCELMVPASVRASSFQDPNVPSNTLDGDLDTRWSAEGSSEWIEYDFGDRRRLDGVAVALYQGDLRTTELALWGSTDQTEWTEVASGPSSGSTVEPELWSLAESVEVRYVRVIGRGNSDNLWNSVTEVALCGVDLPDGDPDAGAGAGGFGGSGSGAGGDSAPAPAVPASSSDGCGCVSAGADGRAPGWAWMGLWLLGVAGGRRRSRRAASVGH